MLKATTAIRLPSKRIVKIILILMIINFQGLLGQGFLQQIRRIFRQIAFLAYFVYILPSDMSFKFILYILGALILLGGLFFVFKPKTVQAPQSPIVTNVSTTSANISSKTKTFELVVRDNKLASGSSTLSVVQGDDVDIKITSDVSGEFHLHGYDKFVDLKKDATVELKFNANLSGRFPFEIEDTKTDLGALEVNP